jgi:long-chain acyl-CoA synthetase
MDIRTLCDLPPLLMQSFDRADLLLRKEAGAWRGIPTRVFCRRVRDLALGLVAGGVGPGDRVALLSENRPEWILTDQAILAAGAVTVPIYTSLLPDQVAWILKDSGAAAIVVSSRDQLEKIRAIRAGLPALREVIFMDAGGAAVDGARGWHEVAGRGAPLPDTTIEERRAAVRPDDLASLIYTSGTTGAPKGVMLTHGNFVHNIKACCAAIPFRSTDVCLSFLPLAHVYERLVEFCYLYRGASIAYAESIEAVPQNLREVRPMIACGVPRVFEKVYKRTMEAGYGLPWPRRAIFAWAADVARRSGAATRPGRTLPPALRLQRLAADRLVFRTLRERLGGRLRFFISGSAPLQAEIAEFFHGAGILILEGYGLTETSPVIALNRPQAFRFGTVGPPVDGVEVRVAEDGEILTRSPSVMRGYFGNDEATREAIRDGWFHTGDIGRIDADGYLTITDRKKELLKTSGGKFVAPQPIENLLRSDRFVQQAIVVGDGRHFVAALIVPAFDQLAHYARARGIPFDDPRDLVGHPRVHGLFEKRLTRVNVELPRYEQIKKFRLLAREFTQENGELTPTLKFRRKVIEERYRPIIDGMYEEGRSSGAG